MPTLRLTAHADAPVEEVWKLLHDPARFPEWWSGVETVELGAPGEFTIWPTGYPDFPMAQRLRAEPGDGRLVISCLVSDIVFRWRLRADGDSTDIEMEVDLPEREAHRFAEKQRQLEESMATLGVLAARTA